jgi:hypothetical protein
MSCFSLLVVKRVRAFSSTPHLIATKLHRGAINVFTTRLFGSSIDLIDVGDLKRKVDEVTTLMERNLSSLPNRNRLEVR